jgi:membrane-associated phospholipid phosphatase
MLVALADRRGWARAVGWVALVWLVLGWAARVTMGGHWTSQLVASYALSILMAQGVLRLVRVR